MDVHKKAMSRLCRRWRLAVSARTLTVGIRRNPSELVMLVAIAAAHGSGATYKVGLLFQHVFFFASLIILLEVKVALCFFVQKAQEANYRIEK